MPSLLVLPRQAASIASKTWLLPLVLIASGCATPFKPSTPVTGAQVWTGRFVVVTHGTTVQSQHAAFELRGDAQKGELDVLSPIGTIVVRAVWQPNKATLINGGSYTDYANLDDLSADLGQRNLPVADLFSWLQGTSNSTSTSTRTNDWTVDVCQAQQGRIKATRAQPSPALSLTVVFQPPAPHAPVGCESAPPSPASATPAKTE